MNPVLLKQMERYSRQGFTPERITVNKVEGFRLGANFPGVLMHPARKADEVQDAYMTDTKGGVVPYVTSVLFPWMDTMARVAREIPECVFQHTKVGRLEVALPNMEFRIVPRHDYKEFGYTNVELGLSPAVKVTTPERVTVLIAGAESYLHVLRSVPETLWQDEYTTWAKGLKTRLKVDMAASLLVHPQENGPQHEEYILTVQATNDYMAYSLDRGLVNYVGGAGRGQTRIPDGKPPGDMDPALAAVCAFLGSPEGKELVGKFPSQYRLMERARERRRAALGDDVGVESLETSLDLV